MSLSILNNVAALYAQNNLGTTQAGLQKTLQQLSSGSRINSGADDPSGLSVSDGLTANESALTQSATNATEGIGLLQTADGALSQVTSLLNQAITIATEIGGGTLTGDTNSGQIGSANQDYKNILQQIGYIGSTTHYNSIKVFDSTNPTVINVTDGTSAGTNVYTDYVGNLTTSNIGSQQATSSSKNVANTDSSTAGGSLTLTVDPTNTLSGTLTITGGTGGTYASKTIAAGTTMAQLVGDLTSDPGFGTAGLAIGAVTGNTITITSAGNTAGLQENGPASLQQTGTGGNIGAGVNLQTGFATISAGTAEAAAQAITGAIAAVAYQRGTLGADINELSSAASVASAEQVNLASAQNAVMATDYGQAASNLSKFQILSQTGISALAQANSVQQEVLKLLQ
jgi:flagellin